MTLVFIILFVLNVSDIINAGTLFSQKKVEVIQRNKAFSIYLKSIFNPNATYVDRFNNGSLLDNLDFLNNRFFNYTTFLGNVVTENEYYLFNTQIPSTLQRLVSNPITYSNATVDISPPTNA